MALWRVKVDPVGRTGDGKRKKGEKIPGTEDTEQKHTG